jgi:lipid II:glycine glycyltransferase (peptidoglycan interpeptide bridge formation enzyme)
MNWNGYEIYQNRKFAELYSKNTGKELREIGNSIVYLTLNSLLGYMQAELLFPEAEGLRDTIDKCREFCREKSIPKLVIKTPHSDIISKHVSAKVTGTDSTVVIPLDKGTDEIWKALKKETRNQVRQSEKKGVRVTEGNADDFETWWNMYRENQKIKNFPITDRELVKNAFLDREISSLFISSVDDEMAAGALVLVSRGAMWWLGASNDELLRKRPNHLLQWEIIKWAKERNHPFYDMGGIKPQEPDHGPTRFKRGWSGKECSYSVYEEKIRSVKSKVIDIGRDVIPRKMRSTIRRRMKKKRTKK